MGRFAELCKGKTMGVFFLPLLSSGAAHNGMAENQTTPAGEL